MAKYTVIADTSERLINILQEALVPELIQTPSEIGMRSPEEQGDVSLGLFLYEIRESEEIRQRGNIVTHEKIAKAPIYLTLFYMITAYAHGDSKYRLQHEEKILGKVIQTFYDNPIIPLEEIDQAKTSGTDIHIQLMKMGVDEKSRIWNFPNVGNRLSLFYKVSPVTIDSEFARKVSRVTELDINISTRLR